MGAFALFLHLLGFLAPAVFVGTAVALGARLLIGRAPQGGTWWAHSAINSVAGAVALAAGLRAFGVDGKMATYAACVAAIATSQWILSRAWR